MRNTFIIIATLAAQAVGTGTTAVQAQDWDVGMRSRVVPPSFVHRYADPITRGAYDREMGRLYGGRYVTPSDAYAYAPRSKRSNGVRPKH